MNEMLDLFKTLTKRFDYFGFPHPPPLFFTNCMQNMCIFIR